MIVFRQFFQLLHGLVPSLRPLAKSAAIITGGACLACAFFAIPALASDRPFMLAQAQGGESKAEVLSSETTRIRGWVVNCVTMADANRSRSCAAKLTVTRPGTEGPIFVWEIVLNPQRAIISALQVPTGVLIEPGVEFRSGGASVRRIKLLGCAPARCTAGFATDESVVRAFAATPKLEAVVKDLKGADLVIPMDVTGIEEAYATLVRTR